MPVYGSFFVYHLVLIPELNPDPIKVVIDTGASKSFFDPTNLPSVTDDVDIGYLDVPMELELFDGSYTDPLSLFIRTTIHSRPTGPIVRMRLFQTKLPSSIPIILGMDYLVSTRPQIDWDELLLHFPEAPRPAPDPSGEFEMIQTPQMFDLIEGATFVDTIGGDSLSRLLLEPQPSSPVPFLFDPEEEPDDVADILKVVPEEYHSFLDVFSKVKADQLPPHRRYDHHIDLLDEKDLPPVGPIYSTSTHEAKALKTEIDTLLGKGFIRPSSAPLGAPVLFNKKKDGGLRMCIDYRQLNLRTKKNKYPLPPINYLLEQLSGAKIFSKIDLRGAYHLLRIAEGHEFKTTFRCRYGSYEFLVMPFGLTNAPSAFQHYVNDILHEHLDKFVIAYLDDILIYSNDEVQHRDHVFTVLGLLRKHNLYAKATKCAFGITETEFLGYIVSQDGLKMDPSKVNTVLDWPIPHHIKAVQSFLGFANFYRRFIRNYSRIVSPLTALTKKDTPFLWTDQCQKAFDELKQRFVSAPILRHFDPKANTILETDASDYAVGTILSQIGPDNVLHPIAFDSRKFLPAEMNYEIHDKELLAIVWAFKRWRSYLLSVESPITVYTDHQALSYFMTSKQLTRRQVRWSEVLSDYDFLISYRPGKQSDKPDALSRRDDVYPTGGDASTKDQQNFTTLLKANKIRGFLATTDDRSVKNMVAAQTADEKLIELRQFLTSEEHSPKVTLREDGVLLLDSKIAVPDDDATKLRIMRLKHDHPTAGHPGISKTIKLIKRDFFWKNPKSFVTDYIKTCMKCARNKPLRSRPYGLLQPLPVADRPWSSLSMDFIDQLPPSESFDSILVVVCRFTKMALFIPTRVTATSKDLANDFLQHVFSKHGLPADIVSDRGSKFISSFWKALCEKLSIDRKVSTAYHPETDGQTERVNQTLEQYIRIYCTYQQDDWVQWLPLAEFAYNNADHASTGTSPFRANYGFDPPLELQVGLSDSRPGGMFAYDLNKVHDMVKATLHKSQEDQKRYADRKRRDSPAFKPGDLVLLSTENIRSTRPTRKFAERFIGPYKIDKQVSSTTYKLILPTELSRLHPVFHVSLLKVVPVSSIRGRTPDPPGPVSLQEEDVFAIRDIVDSRIRRQRLEYKVQWLGYENTPEEFTWEPATNLADATDSIDKFHDTYPSKPKPSDFASNPVKSKPRVSD